MVTKSCYGTEKAMHLYLNVTPIRRCQTLKIVMRKLMRRTFLLNLKMKVTVMKFLIKAIVDKVLVRQHYTESCRAKKFVQCTRAR